MSGGDTTRCALIRRLVCTLIGPHASQAAWKWLLLPTPLPLCAALKCTCQVLKLNHSACPLTTHRHSPRSACYCAQLTTTCFTLHVSEEEAFSPVSFFLWHAFSTTRLRTPTGSRARCDPAEGQEGPNGHPSH